MDTFEQTLQDTLNKLQEKIDAANARIKSDEDLIEEAQKEMLTFQSLLTAYKAKKASDEEEAKTKKKNDSDAAEAFYSSSRSDRDVLELFESINIEVSDEIKQAADEEETKEITAKVAV